MKSPLNSLCSPFDVISLKIAIIRCLGSIVTTVLHTHRAFQVYLEYLQPLEDEVAAG